MRDLPDFVSYAQSVDWSKSAAADGSTVNTTWTTVITVTGQGTIKGIRFDSNSGSKWMQIRLTVDGTLLFTCATGFIDGWWYIQDRWGTPSLTVFCALDIAFGTSFVIEAQMQGGAVTPGDVEATYTYL